MARWTINPVISINKAIYPKKRVIKHLDKELTVKKGITGFAMLIRLKNNYGPRLQELLAFG
jgi:hypothetical protein